jgi:YidC/Oxa1 family membrane protein insertase
MKTEARFLLAVFLMLAVLVGTNRLFPPIVPEGTELLGDSLPEDAPAESVAVPGLPADVVGALDTAVDAAVQRVTDAQQPELTGAVEGVDGVSAPIIEVVVEGPLYRYTFSSLGAQMRSGALLGFAALNRDGPVEIVPDGAGSYLGHKLVVGNDTLDLSGVPFRVEPESGLRLSEGGSSESLRFIYDHPSGDFGFTVEYEFDPSEYTVGVSGEMRGVDRALLVTDLGEGIAYAEVDSALEARSMAYVQNHLQDGVRSTLLEKAEPVLVEGPLIWAAFRSKFFVVALLAGESAEIIDDASYLGGLIVSDASLPERVRVGVAQTVSGGERFAYRLFMGPQDYALLTSLGQSMSEVNPYGWRVFRPIVRPIVSVIMTVLVFLHTQLNMGYGWVLIVFGVLMRVVLFPLNHKAMKAQLRNMAVQPLVKQVQDKHKDNPEKLQKEMMKLYKDHGFNPLAGCLPMLLPWPVLIALFFVFQNTIELRGVSFLWLPDLSAKDPFFILPIILAVSMFLMQWVSLRSLEQENPQMKMMMYIMPPMMLFIFMNLASGLNLYYATANIATLPQQIWIARERAKMKAGPPLTLTIGD